MRAALLLTAGALCLGAGCGAPTPPPPSPAGAANTEDMVLRGDEQLVMRGVEMYMHEIAPTPGLPKSPSFRVRAATFTLLDEAGGVWAFEDAEAVIYGSDEADPDIVVTADAGRLEEERAAWLEGNVVATIDTMTIRLADLDWRNPRDGVEGVAKSDAPLVVDDPGIQVEAGSIRLYPDSKTFELGEVTGIVRFRRDAA